MVDTLGLIIAVVVTDASTDDRQALVELLDTCAARAVAIALLIHALTVTDFDRAREPASQKPLAPFAGVPS